MSAVDGHMPSASRRQSRCSAHVQKVFVHSKKNALIEVHPQVRLPRTFRRFCGLFAQLLQKLSVRSTNSKERMLRVCVLRTQPVMLLLRLSVCSCSCNACCCQARCECSGSGSCGLCTQACMPCKVVVAISYKGLHAAQASVVRCRCACRL